jgi:ABC-type nitrate/sulfonate/bicarbonate transport system permease component
LAARTVPSAAQVSQVIASVHAEFAFFTPTPAQIAQVGNEVCTAFDQGKTVAQVKATAMQMAGAYAALVPAAVVNSAARIIVTLYCPGYTSKLS